MSVNGYQQYEISNFSLPGFACRHNLKYWLREPVVGYGLASHSFDGQSRYANCRHLDEYIEVTEAGKSPVDWQEPVEEARAIEETLFLGLRLNEGVNWSRMIDRFGCRSLEKHESAIRNMIDKGLLEWKGPVVRLTPLGRLLSNEVFQRFV
jgi:oxygen-independent coproporphyrinogen-3 oxidase